MPHAAHFLERLDRVTREQTEFALGLYRDHEAVRYVLDALNLPEDVDRVVLAIGEVSRGPYVVVSRTGHFVTCLGEGMNPKRNVVPRAQLDALLKKVADKRARREMAQRELRPHEEEENLFQRIVVRGSRMAKEDFVALSAFDALLGLSPYFVMIEFAADVIKERPGASNVKKINGAIAKAMEKHDRLTWAVAHLALLSGAGERKDLDAVLDLQKKIEGSPTYLCSSMLGSTFFFRSAWLAARLGKAVLPAYKHTLETSSDWIAMLDAGMGLAALGIRHAALFQDTRKILAAQTPAFENHEKSPEGFGRAAYGQWLVQAMDGADDYVRRSILVGQEVCVGMGDHLDEGHPYKFAKPEDVPEDLAKTAILSFDADPFDEKIQSLLFLGTPLAARAAAEDFYFPRDVVRAWFGTWEADETVHRLERFDRFKRKPQTVQKTPTPGRNDPCPCGSGKKWKRCHGSGAPEEPG